MRHLRIGQLAMLDLDGEQRDIACVVGSVHGSAVMLDSAEPLHARLLESLEAGVFGYLVFSDNGAPIAMRGIAQIQSAAPHVVEFAVVDGTLLLERRRDCRVDLVLPLRLSAFTEAGLPARAVETVTVNLSLGGALVQMRPGLERGSEFELELSLEAGFEPVRCTAFVRGRTSGHLTLEFTELCQLDRVRLGEKLVERQLRTRLLHRSNVTTQSRSSSAESA